MRHTVLDAEARRRHAAAVEDLGVAEKELRAQEGWDKLSARRQREILAPLEAEREQLRVVAALIGL